MNRGNGSSFKVTVGDVAFYVTLPAGDRELTAEKLEGIINQFQTITAGDPIEVNAAARWCAALRQLNFPFKSVALAKVNVERAVAAARKTAERVLKPAPPPPAPPVPPPAPASPPTNLGLF